MHLPDSRCILANRSFSPARGYSATVKFILLFFPGAAVTPAVAPLQALLQVPP